MEPSTETAFYDDPYRRELEAWVDALVEDERLGPALVLSTTLCHPHGGGQKGDRATLVLDGLAREALGDTLAITDTRRSDGRILHLLGAGPDAAALAAAEGALVGTQAFLLRLDWGFRLRQMRLHGAAHLLHCFVEQVLGREVPYPQTSDLQPDHGLNRYESKDLLDAVQAAEVARRLNAFTAEGHPIATWPDADKPGFRYWRCGDWVIPCGGTHLANTEEIGPIDVSLSTKRGRTSLTFRLAAA